MISRETGATLSKADQGGRAGTDDPSESGALVDRLTDRDADAVTPSDERFISSTVLSDVELYRICFK